MSRWGLSRRTAYVGTLLFVALVVLANIVAAVWDRPEAGRQRSSLATSPTGHRAYFELLREAGFEVSRNHRVPRPSPDGPRAFFLIGPQGQLVARDPRYLAALGDWAAEGNSLLIALGGEMPFSQQMALNEEQADQDDETRRRILRRLGFDVEGGKAVFDALALDLKLHHGSPDDDARLTAEPGASGLVEGCTALDTELGAWLGGPGLERARAAVWWGDRAVVLEVPRGLGRIVLVADASLFDNGRIAEADNGVLAYNLAWRYGRGGIVFDEYFHGLHESGSIVKLLCRFPVNVVTASLLLCVGVFVLGRWRHFGPPVPFEERSRRSKAEHIQAMADLFRRTSRTKLTLQQCVAGLVHDLGEAYGLADGHDPRAIIEHLTARCGPRGEALAAAFDRAMAAVDTPRALSERRMRTLYDDLWTPARTAIDAARQRPV